MDSPCARDRSLDYSSDLEVDVLDDGDEGDKEGSTTAATPSVVNNLEKANEAQISRERSMKRTSSERSEASANAKRTKVSLGTSTQVVNVSPQQRAKEFPGEYLTVSSGNSIVKRVARWCP